MQELPDRPVRDREARLPEVLARDRDEPVVEEERDEIVRLAQLPRLEGASQRRRRAEPRDHVLEAVVVAVHLPPLRDHVPDLHVVRPQVLVHELRLRMAVLQEVLHVVEDERRVRDRGDLATVRARLRREAVAVVPPAHRLEDRPLVEGEARVRPVVREHLPEVGVREARERRERGVHGDVRRDVEPARHVVHRDGRHARHEEPRHRRVRPRRRELELVEELLEEPVAVAEGLVALPRLGEDRVREVVVLVDDHVEPHARAREPRRERAELLVARARREDRLGRARRKPRGLALGEDVEPLRAVEVEARLHAVGLLLDAREVEVQDEVLPALVLRGAADVEPAEELVEPVRVVDVVVALEDRAEEGLPEAPRPQEEPVARLLQLADEGRAVHEVAVLRADPREVRHAVHDLLHLLHAADYTTPSPAAANTARCAR